MSFKEHLGLEALGRSGRDARILILQKFFRMLAYGQTTLVLGVFFQELGITDSQIGLFMSLTLLGDVAISYVLTLYGDIIGRRLVLVIGAASMMVSGAVFAMSSNYWVLLAAAVIGVISPSGDEIGPFRSIEESTLAHLTTYAERSDIFAWSGVVGTLGGAIGTLSGGFIVSTLESRNDWTTLRAYRTVFWLYAFWALIKLAMTLFLTPKCESDSHRALRNPASTTASHGETRPLLESAEYEVIEAEAADLVNELSNSDNGAQRYLGEDQYNLRSGNDDPIADDLNTIQDMDLQRTESAGYLERTASNYYLESVREPQGDTYRTLVKLCVAFGLDSVGYSFMPYSWLVLYFVKTFNSSAASTGTLLFITNTLGSITALGSSVMCKRMGPIPAIMVTKSPSAIFMGAISVMPTVFWAMSMVVLAICSDTMDVVPRQVFIASVVPAEDRTMVMGTVNVVKTLARSIGPIFTGIFSEHGELWVSFWFVAFFELVSVACLVLFFRKVQYH